MDDQLPGEPDYSPGEDDYPGRPDTFAGRKRDLAGRNGAFEGGGSGDPTALDYLDGSYTPDDKPSSPSGRPNGFAIAAFVLGAIGGTILSIILAVIALRQIRDTGQRGRGLAIAGIVTSVVWAGVVAGFLFLYNPGPSAPPSAASGTSASPAGTSPSGSPSGSSSSGSGSGNGGNGGSSHQNANVFSLSAGQCFQNPSSSEAVLGITHLTVVPCTTPHNAQIVAEFAATGTKYPGADNLKSQADQGCHDRLTGRLVDSRITSTMTLRFLYPLASSWATGLRTISCLVVDAKPDLKYSLLR